MISFTCKCLFGWAFVLAAGICAAGQDCPQFSVFGPPGMVEVGDPARYGVRFQGSVDPASFTYHWEVSRGEITSGQGTDTVVVKQPDDAFTATVEVFGLPTGCPATASETGIYDRPPLPTLVYEGKGPVSQISREELDNITEAVGNEPGAQIYVIVRHRKSGTSSVRKTREQLLKTFPLDDPKRFTYVDVPDDTDLLKIYVVPPGATPPLP
jgi:hypothetical protein